MNLEKFTERSRGFLQSAQTIAMRESHQRVLPEHLLKAILDDDQGLAANLIDRAGGSSARVREAVDNAVQRLPKVSGDAGQTYIDSALVRVLDEAEKVATKAGDSFVPVERILIALAMVGTIVVEGISGADDPVPLLAATAQSVTPAAQNYVVTVSLTNQSRRTAAAVQVEGVLKRGGEEVETSSATIDYVPGHSDAKGGLIFTEDPRAHQLELRVTGYEHP